MCKKFVKSHRHSRCYFTWQFTSFHTVLTWTIYLLGFILVWLNHKGPSHSTSEAGTSITLEIEAKARPWKQEPAIGYNMARCQVSPIGLSRSYLLQLEAFSIHHASFGIADIRWKFNPLYSITRLTPLLSSPFPKSCNSKSRTCSTTIAPSFNSWRRAKILVTRVFFVCV